MNGQEPKTAKKAPAPNQKNIHAGHRQRKREQFLRHGADAFADHELLELLLFYAIPRADTNPIAHNLLERFGSLEGLLAAPAEEIAKVEGMGVSSALLIALIGPFFRRAEASSQEIVRILDTTRRLGEYFLPLFTAEKHEIMYQLCLDAKGRKLNLYKLNEGGPTGVGFNMREVMANALASNAAQIVLAHNHPSGVALPSPEDIASTDDVRDALRTIHVVLSDHIIVADGEWVSFRESRLL